MMSRELIKLEKITANVFSLQRASYGQSTISLRRIAEISFYVVEYAVFAKPSSTIITNSTLCLCEGGSWYFCISEESQWELHGLFDCW